PAHESLEQSSRLAEVLQRAGEISLLEAGPRAPQERVSLVLGVAYRARDLQAFLRFQDRQIAVTLFLVGAGEDEAGAGGRGGLEFALASQEQPELRFGEADLAHPQKGAGQVEPGPRQQIGVNLALLSIFQPGKRGFVDGVRPDEIALLPLPVALEAQR